MNLIEVLEPIDLPNFRECSGVIDGWGITITKTGQETASPTWVMPEELDASMGAMRPWCWRSNLDAQVKRLQGIMEAQELTECDFNISFPLEGTTYTITTSLRRIVESLPELEQETPALASTSDKERSIRRLQKRAGDAA